MDSIARRIINKNTITISELGILFLESKYKNISMISYGTYQNRIKIINEYFGNSLLKNITEDNIKKFENYLQKNKKWKYIEKPANYHVKMIINTLKEMLNKAIAWNLIKKIPKTLNTNESLTSNTSTLKNINNLLMELEQRRALNEMENI